MTLYLNTNDTNTAVNLHFSVLSSFNLNAAEPSMVTCTCLVALYVCRSKVFDGQVDQARRFSVWPSFCWMEWFEVKFRAHFDTFS
jgi:hypothetical protein